MGSFSQAMGDFHDLGDPAGAQIKYQQIINGRLQNQVAMQEMEGARLKIQQQKDLMEQYRQMAEQEHATGQAMTLAAEATARAKAGGDPFEALKAIEESRLQVRQQMISQQNANTADFSAKSSSAIGQQQVGISQQNADTSLFNARAGYDQGQAQDARARYATGVQSITDAARLSPEQAQTVFSMMQQMPGAEKFLPASQQTPLAGAATVHQDIYDIQTGKILTPKGNSYVDKTTGELYQPNKDSMTIPVGSGFSPISEQRARKTDRAFMDQQIQHKAAQNIALAGIKIGDPLNPATVDVLHGSAEDIANIVAGVGDSASEADVASGVRTVVATMASPDTVVALTPEKQAELAKSFPNLYAPDDKGKTPYPVPRTITEHLINYAKEIYLEKKDKQDGLHIGPGSSNAPQQLSPRAPAGPTPSFGLSLPNPQPAFQPPAPAAAPRALEVVGNMTDADFQNYLNSVPGNQRGGLIRARADYRAKNGVQ